MQVNIYFDDIDVASTQAKIIREWLDTLIRDKSTDNLSPLRYADRFDFD